MFDHMLHFNDSGPFWCIPIGISQSFLLSAPQNTTYFRGYWNGLEKVSVLLNLILAVVYCQLRTHWVFCLSPLNVRIVWRSTKRITQTSEVLNLKIQNHYFNQEWDYSNLKIKTMIPIKCFDIFLNNFGMPNGVL